MRRGCDSLGGPNGRKSQCTRRGWGGVGGPGSRRPSLRGARAGPCSPQGGLWPLPGDKAPPRERPVDGVLSIPLSVAPAAPGPVPRTLYQAPPPPDASRGADEAAWGTLFLPWYLLSQTGDTGLIGSSSAGEGACRGRPQLTGPSAGQTLLSRTPVFLPVTAGVGLVAPTPRDVVATRPARSLRTWLVRGGPGRAARGSRAAGGGPARRATLARTPRTSALPPG